MMRTQAHSSPPRVGCTPQHISEVELAKAYPSEELLALVDQALDAGGRLLELYPAVIIERERKRQKRSRSRREALRSREEVEEAKRRTFIGLGLAVALFGPEAAAHASSDDWDRIAYAWANEINTTSDMQALIPGLVADLKRLQARGGPQRVVAQLTSHVATIAVSGGDTAMAKRWWHRAQSAAIASGDRILISYVTGRAAVEGLYGGFSPGEIVALADKALQANTAPCAGRVEAIAARAQALAMQGRERDANEALSSLERTFEKLPHVVTRDQLSSFGWSEQRLHHVHSYCSMYGVCSGEIAQAEALRLYPDAMWRGPVQIKLHRAASEADAQYAVATLSDLSDAQRSNRFVLIIAKQALARCEAQGANASELSDVLT